MLRTKFCCVLLPVAGLCTSSANKDDILRSVVGRVHACMVPCGCFMGSSSSLSAATSCDALHSMPTLHSAGLPKCEPSSEALQSCYFHAVGKLHAVTSWPTVVDNQALEVTCSVLMMIVQRHANEYSK